MFVITKDLVQKMDEMLLKAFLKKIDMFKSEPKIYANKHENIPSIIGGMVSLFLIFFLNLHLALLYELPLHSHI